MGYAESQAQVIVNDVQQRRDKADSYTFQVRDDVGSRISDLVAGSLYNNYRCELVGTTLKVRRKTQ